MPKFTRTITRQTLIELKYLLYSKFLYAAVAFLLFVSYGAVLSCMNNVRQSSEHFARRVKTYEEHGESIAEILKAPTEIIDIGNQGIIKNPLKYDFIEMSNALEALTGQGLAGSTIEFSTFLAFPLLFALFGAFLATRDIRAQTIHIRASLENRGRIVLSAFVTMLLSALGAITVVAVAAVVLGAIHSGQIEELRHSIDFETLTPESRMHILGKVGFSVLVSMFFGVWGYALGYLTRSALVPTIAATLYLFVLQFFSALDPRNLLAHLSMGVFDYWGGFKIRPPIEVTTTVAVAMLIVYSAIPLAIMTLSARTPKVRD